MRLLRPCLARLSLGRPFLRLRQCSQLHEGSGPRISIDFANVSPA
jgi:hypothetical protein